MRDRRALTILALVAASALCVVTVELRIHETGDGYYRFLVWNLTLAWVPFAFALAAYDRARRRVDAGVAALAAVWLLFFPNAPYVLTDFIHLRRDAPAPVWYDALMLSAFAWTALLLGFASLYLMQTIARRVVGSAWSWVGVAGALAVASFGVYLGRFVRLNSWDALVRPRRVADVIANQLENPLSHPRMVAVLIVLTGFLLVGYAVVYSFAGLRLQLEREESPAAPRR
jgi:uncharacterized membrane protein